MRERLASNGRPFVMGLRRALDGALLRLAGYRADGWVLATIGAWAAGWALMGIAPDTLQVPVAGTAGIAVGLSQWLLLRRQLAVSGWLIPANALGLAAAVGLRQPFGLWAALLPGAATGAVLVLLSRSRQAPAQYS